MSEALSWVLAGVAGGGIGAIFFGGLWWTVRKGVAAKQPGLWFLGSLLLRMGIALAGFCFILRQHWQWAPPCLLGFVAARWAVTQLTRHPWRSNRTRPAQEDSHAY